MIAHSAGGILGPAYAEANERRAMPEQYRLPYTLREPSPETEDMYFAEVPVLPGCRAWGSTPEEALRILDSVATEFIASYKSRGDDLPEGIAQAGELVVAV